MVSKGVVAVLLVLAAASVIADNTFFSSGLFALGKQVYHSGDVVKAAALFEKAYELYPGQCNALHNRGVIAYEAGKLESAQTLFEQAIECDPSYTKAHYSLALLSNERGEKDAAIEHLNDVIRLDPENQEAHFDLGIVITDQYRSGETDLESLVYALTLFEFAKDIQHSTENAEVLRKIILDTHP